MSTLPAISRSSNRFRPISGHFWACYKSLIDHLPFQDRHRMCEVIGMEPGTLRRWYIKASQPTPPLYAKVYQVLKIAGFTVLNVGFTPDDDKASRYIADLIGLDIMKANEIATFIGVQQPIVNRIMFSGGIIPAQMEMLELLADDNAEKVEGAYDKLAENLSWLPDVMTVEVVKSPAPRPDDVQAMPSRGSERYTPWNGKPQSGGIDKEKALTILSDLILAITPLASWVASSDFAPEDREDLRQKVGFNGVFHLKCHLALLCGEPIQVEE